MKTVSPFSACWVLFSVGGSEGGSLSACRAAAAAAGTDSGRGASWGGVHRHFAAHDGAGPVCDDAGADAWADGVGAGRDVGAADQGARALSPFIQKKMEKNQTFNSNNSFQVNSHHLVSVIY